MNAATVTNARLPLEFRGSPYRLPVSLAVQWLETWFPRKAFVLLEQLITRQVDPAHLAAIGSLLQVGHDLRQWRLSQDVAEVVNLLPAPPAKQPAAILAEAHQANARIQALPSGQFQALKRVSAEVAHLSHTTEQLAAIEARIATIPRLLLGAVDVRQGTFQAFDSWRNEITIDAAIASATLPSIFKAREVAGQFYWDGLFSQNPPLRSFLADVPGVAAKPDELWVVQINPQRVAAVPEAAEDIQDRHNELAGNLSLNQEIAMIETVNRWYATGRLGSAAAGYKPISLHRIPMDSHYLEREAHVTLDAASKLERRPQFIQTLIQHGQAQVQHFWLLHGVLEEIVNECREQSYCEAIARLCTPECVVTMSGHTATSHQEIADGLGDLRTILPDLRVVIQHIAFERRAAAAVTVVLEWQAMSRLTGGGTLVRLEGQAHVVVVECRIARVDVSDLQVTNITSLQGHTDGGAGSCQDAGAPQKLQRVF